MDSSVNVRKLTGETLLQYDKLRKKQKATWDDIDWDEVELISGSGDPSHNNVINVVNTRPAFKELYEAQKTAVELMNEGNVSTSGYCDIRFVVDDGCIPVHGVFLGLAEKSKFFREIYNDFIKKSSREDVIVLILDGIKLRHLRIVLSLLYTGQAVYSVEEEEDVQSLMKMFDLQNFSVTRAEFKNDSKQKKKKTKPSLMAGLLVEKSEQVKVADCNADSREATPSKPMGTPEASTPKQKPNGPRLSEHEHESEAETLPSASAIGSSSASASFPVSSPQPSSSKKTNEILDSIPLIQKVQPGSLFKKSRSERIQRSVADELNTKNKMDPVVVLDKELPTKKQSQNRKKIEDNPKAVVDDVENENDEKSEYDATSNSPPNKKRKVVAKSKRNTRKKSSLKHNKVTSSSSKRLLQNENNEKKAVERESSPTRSTSSSSPAVLQVSHHVPSKKKRLSASTGDSSSDDLLWRVYGKRVKGKRGQKANTETSELEHEENQEFLSRAKSKEGKGKRGKRKTGKKQLDKNLEVHEDLERTALSQPEEPFLDPTVSSSVLEKAGSKLSSKTKTKRSIKNSKTETLKPTKKSSKETITEDYQKEIDLQPEQPLQAPIPSLDFVCGFCGATHDSLKELRKHLLNSCALHLQGMYRLKKKYCGTCDHFMKSSNYTDFTVHLKGCTQSADEMKQRVESTNCQDTENSSEREITATPSPLPERELDAPKTDLKDLRQPIIRVNKLTDEKIAHLIDLIQKGRKVTEDGILIGTISTKTDDVTSADASTKFDPKLSSTPIPVSANGGKRIPKKKKTESSRKKKATSSRKAPSRKRKIEEVDDTPEEDVLSVPSQPSSTLEKVNVSDQSQVKIPTSDQPSAKTKKARIEKRGKVLKKVNVKAEPMKADENEAFKTAEANLKQKLRATFARFRKCKAENSIPDRITEKELQEEEEISEYPNQSKEVEEPRTEKSCENEDCEIIAEMTDIPPPFSEPEVFNVSDDQANSSLNISEKMEESDLVPEMEQSRSDEMSVEVPNMSNLSLSSSDTSFDYPEGALVLDPLEGAGDAKNENSIMDIDQQQQPSISNSGEPFESVFEDGTVSQHVEKMVLDETSACNRSPITSESPENGENLQSTEAAHPSTTEEVDNYQQPLPNCKIISNSSPTPGTLSECAAPSVKISLPISAAMNPLAQAKIHAVKNSQAEIQKEIRHRDDVENLKEQPEKQERCQEEVKDQRGSECLRLVATGLERDLESKVEIESPAERQLEEKEQIHGEVEDQGEIQKQGDVTMEKDLSFEIQMEVDLLAKKQLQGKEQSHGEGEVESKEEVYGDLDSQKATMDNVKIECQEVAASGEEVLTQDDEELLQDVEQYLDKILRHEDLFEMKAKEPDLMETTATLSFLGSGHSQRCQYFLF